MLQNAYFLAKIGADTAENEQHFAEILPIGRRVEVRKLRTYGLEHLPAIIFQPTDTRGGRPREYAWLFNRQFLEILDFSTN